MDRGAIEICQALNLDRYESIKVLLRICQRQKYLDRSRIYQPDRKFLDGSRSYREVIDTNSKKLDGSNMR